MSCRLTPILPTSLAPAILDRRVHVRAVRGEPAVRDFLLGGAAVEALGSNNWVVDGTMTASGKPLLANDPHLGTHLPSTLVSRAHVRAAISTSSARTLPGTPAVALGRNRFIAWGATNVAADVQDLYRERLDADRHGSPSSKARRSRCGRSPKPSPSKAAPPVHVNVRITRHGPLVSDAINANNAAQSTARRSRRRSSRSRSAGPRSIPRTRRSRRSCKVNEAHNWTRVHRRAAPTSSSRRRTSSTPTSTATSATTRPDTFRFARTGDGSQPADGWTGDAEWTGWVPFDELPHVSRSAGALHRHGQQSSGARRLPATCSALEWTEPYRAQRITDLLRPPDDPAPCGSSRRTISRASRRTRVSLHAKALLPLLLAHAHPDDARDRQALDLLAIVELRRARRQRGAPAIFQAWFLRAGAGARRATSSARSSPTTYGGKFSFVTRFVDQHTRRERLPHGATM